MGVADFPVEILKSIRVKTEENRTHSQSSKGPTPTRSASLETGVTPRSSTPVFGSVSEGQDEQPRHSSEISTGMRSETSLPSLNTLTPQSSLPSSPPNEEIKESQTRQSLDATTVSDHDRTQSPTLLSPTLPSPTLQTSNPEIPAPQSPVQQSPNGEGSFPQHRQNSMAQVFGGLSRKSSGSRRSQSPAARHKRSSSHLRSDSPSGKISLDTVAGASKSVSRIVETGLKSPMDFTLALARGFHNAPKLYGDETVRTADKITGIQSGLKAAGKVNMRGIFPAIKRLTFHRNLDLASLTESLGS